MQILVLVIGVVLFIEGLPYLASPNTAKRMMVQMLQVEGRWLRIMGFFAMSAGLLLVWLGSGMG